MPHPLTTFEKQKFYQNEPRFNEIYSRDNLPEKIKDGAYLTNLDEHSDIGTNWIALYALDNNDTYFESSEVERMLKEIKKCIDKSRVVNNIFRIQKYDSVMCRYFCIRFIDFMLKAESLAEFTNLFSLNNFEKNDDTILHYCKINLKFQV